MARGLQDRVASNAVATRDNSAANGRDVTGTNKSLAQQIRDMESQFALAMPRGAEASQLVRDALTVLRGTPKLAECEATTVLGGLMTCAQLGLRPGVLGHAWLLPFYSSKNHRMEAQLIIGYKGLIALAHRSGQIESLIARTIYSNDIYEIDYGLEDKLVHKPTLQGAKGDPVGYYAVAKFTTGGHAFIFVNHDEMIEHKNRFAMAKTREGNIVGPWVDSFDGMAHKTCVRELSKWMPQSTELSAALEADESVRVDVSPTADPVQVSRIVEGEYTVDTNTGEVVDQDGPTAADLAAINAEAAAAVEVEEPPSEMFQA